MDKNKKLLLFLFLPVITVVLFLFQNCAPQTFQKGLRAFQARTMSLELIHAIPSESTSTDLKTNIVQEVNFDGNNQSDFIIAYSRGRYGVNVLTNGTEICLNALQNRFVNCHWLPIPSFTDINSVSVVDFNKDGKEDYVLFGQDIVVVLINKGLQSGRPNFEVKYLYDYFRTRLISANNFEPKDDDRSPCGKRELFGTIADLDGNGQPDIVFYEVFGYGSTCTTYQGAPVTSALKVVKNISMNKLDQMVDHLSNTGKTLLDEELELPNTFEKIHRENIAAGRHQYADMGGHESNDIRAIDLDGDGKDEIFIKNEKAEPHYILKYQNNLMNLVSQPRTNDFTYAGRPQFIDLNGDGILDILIPQRSSDQTAILVSTGVGLNYDTQTLNISQAGVTGSETIQFVADLRNVGVKDFLILSSTNCGWVCTGMNLSVNWGISNGPVSPSGFSIASLFKSREAVVAGDIGSVGGGGGVVGMHFSVIQSGQNIKILFPTSRGVGYFEGNATTIFPSDLNNPHNLGIIDN